MTSRRLPRRPIRVMHVVFQLGIGGMEVGVVKLANSLPRDSVVTSICSAWPAADLKYRLAPDVRVYELHRRRSGNDVRMIQRLYRALRQEQPDILHTHRWATLGEGIAAAHLAGVPSVVHGEHGTLEVRRRNRHIQRWLWRRCDRVLSVSSRLAERMSREIGFPLEHIETIRNGVDLDRFGASDGRLGRRLLSLDDDCVTIGTVGRLVPVKDHAMLLHAFAVLRQRGHEFRAAIVGDGVQRADLERLAANLGLRGVVRFAGHLEDVPTALGAFDIFALPSKSEGLSNTIQEAMATGLPVVATRVGGADELVTHGTTGVLVPPGDPVAFASALEQLLNDAGRRASMGAAGQRIARTKFSLQLMLSEYERLYRDVAEARLARNLKLISAQS